MLGGGVGMYEMRGEVAKEGVLRLMEFGGFVSMKLGMVNMF